MMKSTTRINGLYHYPARLQVMTGTLVDSPMSIQALPHPVLLNDSKDHTVGQWLT